MTRLFRTVPATGGLPRPPGARRLRRAALVLLVLLVLLLAAKMAPTEILKIRQNALRGFVGSYSYDPWGSYLYPPVKNLRVTDLFPYPRALRVRWDPLGSGYTYQVRRNGGSAPGMSVTTTQASVDDRFDFNSGTTYTYTVTVTAGPAAYPAEPSQAVSVRVVPLNCP